MNLPGLHHEIAAKRAAAGSAARTARMTSTDPRTAYELGVTAERLALEAEQLSDHLHGNEQTMEGILHMVNYLAKSPHKSRHRSIALTELENAYARLAMENGQREPECNFEIHPPETTTAQATS